MLSPEYWLHYIQSVEAGFNIVWFLLSAFVWFFVALKYTCTCARAKVMYVPIFLTSLLSFFYLHSHHGLIFDEHNHIQYVLYGMNCGLIMGVFTGFFFAWIKVLDLAPVGSVTYFLLFPLFIPLCILFGTDDEGTNGLKPVYPVVISLIAVVLGFLTITDMATFYEYQVTRGGQVVVSGTKLCPLDTHKQIGEYVHFFIRANSCRDLEAFIIGPKLDSGSRTVPHDQVLKYTYSGYEVQVKRW